MLRIGLFSIFLLALLGVEPSVGAAFSYGEERLALTLEPSYPQAESIVTARVDDYSIAIPTSGIKWYLNGELQTDANNQREFEFSSGPIGSKTEVEAVLTFSNNETARVKQVIEPSFLDLIIEAQTRTPAFYQGRALPSIGSRVNVIAITAIEDIISPQDLIYTWRLNDRVLEGGPVRGKNSVSFEMPQGEFATLAVSVSRPDGTTFAQKFMDIPSFMPELVFYEQNLLFGTKQKAAVEEMLMLGNTITIRAEPYYLDLDTFNRPDHLEWEIDNRNVATPQPNPYELTIERTGGSGVSLINLHVRNTRQVLQGVESSISLRY